MAENPSTTNPNAAAWAEVFDAQKSVIERLTPPVAVLAAAKKLNDYVGYYHGCHADINLVTGWLLSLPPAVVAESVGTGTPPLPAPSCFWWEHAFANGECPRCGRVFDKKSSKAERR